MDDSKICGGGVKDTGSGGPQCGGRPDPQRWSRGHLDLGARGVKDGWIHNSASRTADQAAATQGMKSVPGMAGSGSSAFVRLIGTEDDNAGADVGLRRGGGGAGGSL